jgi:hypothetical protein
MVVRLVAAALILAASGCAAAPAPAASAPIVEATLVPQGAADRRLDDAPSSPRWRAGALGPAVLPASTRLASTRLAVTSAVDEPGAAPDPGATSAAPRCPEGMALVGDRLCIDRWEATVVVARGGVEEAHSPFEPLDAVDAPYRAVTAPGVTPQGYVSGKQAEAACRASGKRLCTASEWELACRGPERRQFPYGDRRVPRACNDDVRSVHPVLEAARRSGVPMEQAWTTGMNLPLVNQLPGGLAATGEREACTTPEGVFDLVGNLHEWVADREGTFRGGFYMDTSQNGEGCAYQTTAHDMRYHDYSTGFRCCAHAEE